MREHSELRVAIDARGHGLDHVEARVAQPLGAVDVAHESRDARARLGGAAQLDSAALLHDLEEIHSFGDRVDELVEQMDDLGTRALQLSDDLHAREQTLTLAFEARDLGDLLVELGDLAAQDLVAALLRARPALHGELGHVHDARAHDQGAYEGDEEFLLAPLAQLGTPGQ